MTDAGRNLPGLQKEKALQQKTQEHKQVLPGKHKNEVPVSQSWGRRAKMGRSPQWSPGSRDIDVHQDTVETLPALSCLKEARGGKY